MDDQVKAIVLRIDSGGGSKAASQMILSELQVAQAAGIPVVASMSSVAGSGGYWIASSADEIWASPDTITGSIGVIGILPSFDKALARDMDVDAVDDIARGRIWTGDAALQRGLVDELGNIEQAIDSAAKLTGIDDYSVWYVQPTVTLEERLLRQLMATASSAMSQLGDNLLTQAISRLAQEVDLITDLNDPRYTYLWCTECPAVH